MKLPATRTKISPIDVIFTAILYLIAVLISFALIFWSFFFVMATDACGPDDCHTGYLTAAYFVTWGGVVAALTGSLVMIFVAASKRWMMWFWPLIAIATIVVTFALGGWLADQVNP